MQTIFYGHIGFAYISLALLLLRGVLSAKMIDWRQYKLLKIAPHIVDSLLLISGILLFWQANFSLTESWIWAKLLFLVLYILFAIKAFRKSGFSLKHFLLAVVSFMLTMLVAVIH